MLLRYSFQREREATAIEEAVKGVLRSGARTGDILQPGGRLVETGEMGDLVARAVEDWYVRNDRTL
jgi:3-isopropylmalate dehydrogenase